MRIIKGTYKGYQIPSFRSKGIKPTTDRTKESIFSQLEARIDFEHSRVLDLFAGSGSVSLEFLSRGAKQVCSVDQGKESIRQMLSIKKELKLTNWDIHAQDALKWLKQSKLDRYSILFADPPYHMTGLHQFVEDVLQMAAPSAWFVVEHKAELVFSSSHLQFTKLYGKSACSFFQTQ